MSRLTNHAVRAGASAVGVAAGLMFLASTSQTPDGFTQASFDGPLSIFGNSAERQGDVMAIGDGAGDTSELAAILNGPTPAGSPKSPFQEAFEAGAGPVGVEVSAIPTAEVAVAAPTAKQALSLPAKSVVDSQGRVDCTGSVSCLTDPATKVTTVTYPDGVVALVQKINDMTVVAYKSVADALLPANVQALLPSTPVQAPVQQAATPMPAASVPTVQAPAPETVETVVKPDPTTAQRPPEISASTVRPRVIVLPTPQDLASDHTGSDEPGGVTIPPINPTSPVDVVKDAIDSVVGAVTGHHASQTKKPTTSTPEPSPASESASDSAGGSGQ